MANGTDGAVKNTETKRWTTNGRDWYNTQVGTVLWYSYTKYCAEELT